MVNTTKLLCICPPTSPEMNWPLTLGHGAAALKVLQWAAEALLGKLHKTKL